MKFIRVYRDDNKCRRCNFCSEVFRCYGLDICTGCGACIAACPYDARIPMEYDITPKYVTVYINGEKFCVPQNITIYNALITLGFKIDAPCRIGGCWSCVVVADGKLVRSCITPIMENMVISTDTSSYPPRRVVHGPSPHIVGGKGTPWWQVDQINYVEAAIWTGGCNLRCGQCQNYHVTYDNTSSPLTPYEAATRLYTCHKLYKTRGLAISGGEPTINRRWLISLFKELSKLVEPDVRLHLDSNGTMLTPDYIDQLIEAGCNNIGVEPKTYSLESYMKVTNIYNREKARKYHETSWQAIKYIVDNYIDRIYLGVGLIYNEKLVSLEEIAKAGDKIARINPEVQVTVLDYFPTFKRRDLNRPSLKEMLKVKEILEDCGLKCVIVQTSVGHIGPGKYRGLNYNEKVS